MESFCFIACVDSSSQNILRHARSGIIRPRDLEELGISRGRLGKLVESGELRRIGRGLYTATDSPITENHSLAIASKRYPNAVVCVLSAAQFHSITQEMPAAVWMAIPRGARVPRPTDFKLRPVRVSDRLFPFGIEEHKVEGLTIKVYSVARTVADGFKFRTGFGERRGDPRTDPLSRSTHRDGGSTGFSPPRTPDRYWVWRHG